MLLHANAKINWSLDITGQREDGYHLLDMVMQPVTLHDEITIEPADTLKLTCSGAPYLPPNENHLALRAAKALREATGCSKGAAIHVCKHIPVGAGMGGGSTDAAAVLFGLNRLWSLGLDELSLEKIGLTLGADVPFCLRGGLQHTRGIGEQMMSPGKASSFPLVVIQPCEGLSTGAVFKAYHAQNDITHPDTDAVIRVLLSVRVPELSSVLGNVLQPVSEAMRPSIAQAISQLREQGAAAALMTGSGSAVFGVFSTSDSADRAFRSLSVVYSRCFRCDTCDTPVMIISE